LRKTVKAGAAFERRKWDVILSGFKNVYTEARMLNRGKVIEALELFNEKAEKYEVIKNGSKLKNKRINVVVLSSKNSQKFQKKIAEEFKKIENIVKKNKFEINFIHPTSSHQKLADRFLKKFPAQYFPACQLKIVHEFIVPIDKIDCNVPSILIQEKADWSHATPERVVLHELGHAKYDEPDLKILALLIEFKALLINLFHARIIKKFFQTVPWDLPPEYPFKAVIGEAQANRFMFENIRNHKKIVSSWKRAISYMEKQNPISHFIEIVAFISTVKILEMISNSKLCDRTPYNMKSNTATEIGEEMGAYAYEDDWINFLRLFIIAWGKENGLKNIEKFADVVMIYTAEIEKEGVDNILEKVLA